MYSKDPHLGLVIWHMLNFPMLCCPLTLLICLPSVVIGYQPPVLVYLDKEVVVLLAHISSWCYHRAWKRDYPRGEEILCFSLCSDSRMLPSRHELGPPIYFPKKKVWLSTKGLPQCLKCHECPPVCWSIYTIQDF